MKRHHILLALMLSAAPALAARDYAQEALPDPRQETQAVALMDTIRCLVCQGQPISGSNADLAAGMRRMIRERIAAGEKPEKVRAWLVSRYGDWVSFKPQLKPMTAPLWLIPLGALGIGGWLVLGRLKRTRH